MDSHKDDYEKIWKRAFETFHQVFDELDPSLSQRLEAQQKTIQNYQKQTADYESKVARLAATINELEDRLSNQGETIGRHQKFVQQLRTILGDSLPTKTEPEDYLLEKVGKLVYFHDDVQCFIRDYDV